ncbi:putative pectinesterase/pectinesterase inhibitor 12 [Wolffia australiana]
MRSLRSSSFLLLSLLLASTYPLSESKSSSYRVSAEKLCDSTPHPSSCLKSLDFSINIDINPNLPALLLHLLRFALNEASKLSSLLGSTSTGIVEKQRSTLQDCRDLHEISVSCLKKSRLSLFPSGKKLNDVRTCLSAALTNRATCLDGLSFATGPGKDELVAAVENAYKPVSNVLAVLSKTRRVGRGRRLLRRRRGGVGPPAWLSKRDRRILQSSGDDDGYDSGSVVTVALDGTGNFTRISDAVTFVPNNSADRTIVIVKAGVYYENVEIPSYKTNVVFLGDGSDVTVIRGWRSVRDGWTTFRSATIAVSGEGFLARDIAVENTAGPEKGQAVALRVNADLSAFYHCTFNGYQDTLYVHSFRQFFRECTVSGTVDFIFGNAAVVLQGCEILPKKPLPGQFNAITAQGRDDPNENTGIAIQNCTIQAAGELNGTKTYLGRPWRAFSRTVFMKSFMSAVVDPSGWREWDGDRGLDTLYYGEYGNVGPGAGMEKRVGWAGHHVMGYEDAWEFTVDPLISGDGWLDTTSFPFDEGL